MRRLSLVPVALAGLLLAPGARADIAGDANCDGRIDQQDEPALIEQLFTPGDCTGGDANGDGVVNAADIPALIGAAHATGPVVTFLGVASSSGSPIAPSGTTDSGMPIFVRPVGVGFKLVVEGTAGNSGKAVGGMTDVRIGRPDLQIESQNTLGDGSFDRCPGTVPGIDPANFGPSGAIDQALQAFACGFDVITTRTAVCTIDTFGNPNWANTASQTQFCTQIGTLRQFPSGQTQVTVQLRDLDGNIGPRSGMVVQIGTAVPATRTRTPTATGTPTQPLTNTPTRTKTATTTRTESPTQTATATATARFTEPTSTPIATASPSRSPTASATRFGPSPTPTPTSSMPTASASPSRTATPTATQTGAPSMRTATVTTTPTRTLTRTAALPPTATATMRTPTASASSTRTATTTPGRTFTPSLTVTSGPSPTRTRTATATLTLTRTPTRTSTRTPTASPTRTSAVGAGPVVTFFGIANANDTVATPIATAPGGIPVYRSGVGFGFTLVVEVRRGPSNLAVGNAIYNPDPTDPTARPDFQIEANRALGNGSPAVCDNELPDAGGVPAIAPPNFGVTQMIADALNDFSCRFDNGTGRPGPRGPNDACTLFSEGSFAFVCSSANAPGCTNGASSLQYCGQITRPLTFPTGDTLLTVQVLDTAGNPGQPAQLIIRR